MSRICETECSDCAPRKVFCEECQSDLCIHLQHRHPYFCLNCNKDNKYKLCERCVGGNPNVGCLNCVCCKLDLCSECCSWCSMCLDEVCHVCLQKAFDDSIDDGFGVKNNINKGICYKCLFGEYLYPDKFDDWAKEIV